MTLVVGSLGGRILPAGEELPDWQFSIDRPKEAVDTPDDDFEGGALDSKWTAVLGSAGTIGLTGTTGGIYDIASRDSWLLARVKSGSGGNVQLRQDYTLPDGKSIVLKLSASSMADAQSGIANNDITGVGLKLNNADTAPADGAEWLYLVWDTNSEGWRIIFNDESGVAKSTPSATNACGAPMAQEMYLRILRSGLTYYGFYSCDGAIWVPLSSFTKSAALSNLWIGAESGAGLGSPAPVQAFDWIRLGGNGLDPW